MEAVLLMLEVVAISQVLVWVARGRGDSPIFGWKTDDVTPEDRTPRTWRERAASKMRKG